MSFETALGQVCPIKKVEAAMIAKFPILGSWGSLDVTWADLMFHESEAVVRTMFELMENHNAASYSVHDALIVRHRDIDAASSILKANYKASVGLEPALEIETRQ